MANAPFDITLHTPELRNGKWEMKISSEMLVGVIDLGEGNFCLQMAAPSNPRAVFYRDGKVLGSFVSEGRKFLSIQWLDTKEIELRDVGPA